MDEPHTFDAVIEDSGRGGAWVRVPLDVERIFGTRGRVPVRASFDGVEYLGSIAPIGGSHVLGSRKDILESLGKSVGDHVHVVLERDIEERVVRLPADLAEDLVHRPEARMFFDSLSYTHRKEYVGWITSAKRAETRAGRLSTREALTAGHRCGCPTRTYGPPTVSRCPGPSA